MLISAGDGPNVDLAAPTDKAGKPGREGHGHLCRCHPDRGDEGGRVDFEQGGIAVVGGVEADDGMEMDGAPALVLGHLGEGHPDEARKLAGRDAEQSGQCPLDGDGGPPPQFGTRGVPQHCSVVVVAVDTEGFAEDRVVGAVSGPAGNRAPVGTAPSPDFGMTWIVATS